MSKELEALERIETTFSLNKQGKESAYRGYTNSVYPYYEDFDLVLNALKRLEAIDNANPSEALEILYNNAKLDRDRIEKGGIVTYAEEIEHNERIKPYYETLKQALIKAQEQEKVLEILKKTKNIKTSFYENGSGKHYKLEFDRTKNQTITKEEFNFLKRWIENEQTKY